jgi:hypothetical protein
MIQENGVGIYSTTMYLCRLECFVRHHRDYAIFELFTCDFLSSTKRARQAIAMHLLYLDSFHLSK